MNRRSFLKSSLALPAMMAAVKVMAFEAPRPFRLGVIGTGSRGTNLVQILLSLPEVEIKAVCDVVRERATRAAGMVAKAGGQTPEVYADDDQSWERLLARDDLEAVIIATPVDLHARMAVACMRAGKRPGVEVPAAVTLQECWDLVRTSEKTGIPCMMLENVCYFRNVMALSGMVRQGMFGEIMHCEAGYQHDCRYLMFDAEGKLTWRGQLAATRNGNQYPTHAVGPVAQWMNINRGDRFVSLSSISTETRGLKEYAAAKFGPDHPHARRHYAQGDINTTMLKTAKGRTVTLYYNLSTHRPYDLIQRLEGVKGIYLGSKDSICLQQPGQTGEAWEPFAPYQDKYDHPMWQKLGEMAAKTGGHGGAEYLMFHDFLASIRNREPAPQDVYDAAVWSAIVPLSAKSVAAKGRPLDFPDFTSGRWKG